MAANIFNDLINKRKSIINELYESVHKNKLYFMYVGSTKDVNFFEYYDSKELFNEIKNTQFRFNDALKKPKEMLKKVNEVKMGRKTLEQEKVITNLEKFYYSKEEVIYLFKDYTKTMLDAGYDAKQNETEQDRTGLKILTPEQMLQRLPIAPIQVKLGNDSENLLNEIRQIVRSLYQSKELTKKVYNNIIKSIQL